MRSQKGINSLNSKQKEVYNVVQTWTKDNVQYDGHLLGSIEISAVNIGGTTSHSGPGIKPGTKLLSLNDKSKAAFTNRLSEVKLLIMMNSLWYQVIYGQVLTQGWEKYLQ